MIYDVYNTTTCKSYDLTRIKNELERELITGNGILEYEGERGILKPLKLLVNPDSLVLPFSHPLIIEEETANVVLDLRRIIRLNGSNAQEYTVLNHPEFNLLILRARLTLLTLTDSYQKIRDFDSLPSIIFARWITNSISYRLGLNPSEENTITVLSTVYYLNLLSEDFEPTKLSILIARNTYIDPNFITEIISECEQVTSLNELIEHMKKLINNVRMEKMTLSLFLSSLTYGWRGSAAKETMAICLEHPPTWVACLASAISERSFRDSPISKVAKHYMKGRRDLEFLNRLKSLLVNSEIMTNH